MDSDTAVFNVVVAASPSRCHRSMTYPCNSVWVVLSIQVSCQAFILAPIVIKEHSTVGISCVSVRQTRFAYKFDIINFNRMTKLRPTDIHGILPLEGYSH